MGFTFCNSECKMKLLASVLCVLTISKVQCRILENCECGVGNMEDIDTRIIAGSVTSPHAFPWIIYLWHKGYRIGFCGGAIINDQYILTAGHCVYDAQEPKNTLVIVGAHDTKKQDGIVMQADKFIYHENYKRFQSYDINDIALIKTKKKIQFSNMVLPICLPNPKSVYASRTAVIAGWGKTENRTSSRFLMHSNVRILSDDKCMHVRSIGSKVDVETNLCAYGFETDTCKGDSGSPLIYEITPYKYEMIGIVSWGEGCAPARLPGIYTRVSAYIGWIQRHTQDANYCKASS